MRATIAPSRRVSHAVGTAVLLGFGLILGPSASADESGFTLLVDTLRNSGRNPAVVHSGRITVHVHLIRQPPTEAEFRKELEQYKDQLKERLSLFSSDPVNRKLTQQALDNAEVDYQKSQKESDDNISNYEIVFQGVDPFVDVKQRITSTDPKGGAVREGLLAIGGRHNPSTNTFLRQTPTWSTIDVDHSYMVEPFNEFGRARGTTLQFLTVMLLLGTPNNSDYHFNPETIEKTRVLLTRVGATSGWRVVGKREFEGGTASVLEIAPAAGARSTFSRIGVNRTLVWVDPARGYICPRIEEYSGERPSRVYESSGFFLDRNSGLWWPRLHTDTVYDAESGATKETKIYTMTPERTALNVPVGDEDFTFHATPKMKVCDKQGGSDVVYQVVKAASLRLKDGAFDLANNPALVPERDILGGLFPFQPGRRRTSWIWILALNAGGVGLIAALVYRRSKRKRAARPKTRSAA